MSYDNTNRLAQVALPGGAKFRCRYDTFGRRVAIDSFSGEAPTGATLFFYDGQQIILEISNTATYTYIYGIGIDEPLARCQGDDVVYYHANSLGSIVALTDDSGALIESIEYDVYGLPTVTVEPGKSATGNRYLFTGREWDSETGLYHYRARAYNPQIGRFLQRDPIPSVNLYTYVSNNPLFYTDPLGKYKYAKELLENPCFKEAIERIQKWFESETYYKEEKGGSGIPYKIQEHFMKQYRIGDFGEQVAKKGSGPEIVEAAGIVTGEATVGASGVATRMTCGDYLPGTDTLRLAKAYLDLCCKDLKDEKSKEWNKKIVQAIEQTILHETAHWASYKHWQQAHPRGRPGEYSETVEQGYLAVEEIWGDKAISWQLTEELANELAGQGPGPHCLTHEQLMKGKWMTSKEIEKEKQKSKRK